MRSLAEILDGGTAIEAHEAVAIAQQLIADGGEAAMPPFVAPTPADVFVAVDGRVSGRGFPVAPAVADIAALLEALLPRGGPVRVPGGLRYTIARARLEVVAAPFGSIAEFSAALARHEKGNRREVVGHLYARAATAAASAAAFRERRRSGPTVTELRRQLRRADQERYEALIAAEAAQQAPAVRVRVLPMISPPEEMPLHPSAPPPVRTDQGSLSRAGRLLMGLAAIVLAFVGGYALLDSQPWRDVSLAARRDATTAVSRRSAPSAPASGDVPLAENSAGSDSNAAEPSSPPTSNAGRVFRPDSDPNVGRVFRPGSPAPNGTASVVRALDESADPAFSPSFGANGTALFFHTGRSSDTRSTIGTAQLGEPELHVMKIVDDGSRNFHVQPSPDGRQVAFDSDRDGERGVYVANADGTGVTRVSGAGYAAVPTWSPDGRQLAFVRGEEDRPKVWNLWLLTLDTGDMRRLTSFRYGQTWGASWFADGRHVVYSHEDRLIVHELATGAIREFASPIRGRLVRTPAVSPNGRHVIFQVSKSGGWLLDLEDGSSRQVLHDPTAEEFAWSPDGRRVAFHSQRDGEWSIWFMTSS